MVAYNLRLFNMRRFFLCLFWVHGSPGCIFFRTSGRRFTENHAIYYDCLLGYWYGFRGRRGNWTVGVIVRCLLV